DSSARPIDQVTTNITVGTGAYPLLGGFTAKKLTCTAEPGRYEGSNDLVTGTTNAGVVTAVVDFYVSGAVRPFYVDFGFRNNFVRRLCHNGLNVVCFQWQQDSGSVTHILDWDNIPNAAVILLGRIRVFAGAKDIRTVE